MFLGYAGTNWIVMSVGGYVNLGHPKKNTKITKNTKDNKEHNEYKEYKVDISHKSKLYVVEV